MLCVSGLRLRLQCQTIRVPVFARVPATSRSPYAGVKVSLPLKHQCGPLAVLRRNAVGEESPSRVTFGNVKMESNVPAPSGSRLIPGLLVSAPRPGNSLPKRFPGRVRFPPPYFVQAGGGFAFLRNPMRLFLPF